MHLGQSSLFVNQVTVYSILELKQCPCCQVILKSLQQLSLGNDVNTSDKNIVMFWLKHFISKFFARHFTMHILKEHIFEKGQEQKQNFINIGIYIVKIPQNSLEFAVIKVI